MLPYLAGHAWRAWGTWPVIYSLIWIGNSPSEPGLQTRGGISLGFHHSLPTHRCSISPLMMALETGPGVSVQSSPTLSGIQCHTPSTTSLRQISYPGSSSPMGSSSPIAVSQGEASYWRGQNDPETRPDDDISALDPRRFTPNLHASLVSEILSLRREIESKNSLLGNLEEDLQSAKAENDQLNKSLQNHVAEGRSTKKQMQLLESESRVAVDERTKERDEAVDGLNDARRRLEISKNKFRVQEEEAERSHALWDRDRQVWDVEKRNMDRKIHVVEGRLRTILAEVAAAQANSSHQSTTSNDVDEGMRGTWLTKSSDSNSNRSNSVIERSRSSGMSNGTQDGSDAPNFRYSTVSGLLGFGATSLQGLSLAEELEFDDEENNMEESDVDGGIASPGALPEEAQMQPRRSSLRLHSQDEKARKVLGLLAQTNERLVQEAIMSVRRGAIMDDKGDDVARNHLFQYKDEATQCSPPSSSLGHVQNVNSPVEKTLEQTEHVANQRRKRVSILTTSSEQTQSTKSGHPSVLPMVSAGCQTLEPLSPPQTPVKPSIASDATAFPQGGWPEMKSAMTQTADHKLLKTTPADNRQDSLMTVPIIAIHPPASRPPSSHYSVVLPPQTKNAACQVAIPVPVSSRSVAVQTVEIKRPPRIPLRVISSSQYAEKGSPRTQTSPRKNPRKNVHRSPHVSPAVSRVRASPRTVIDSYPGNNDNGPLNPHSSELRRPIRLDSLFAGFESKHDQQIPRLPPIDFSDDELATMAPIRKTLSKVHNSWKLIPNSKSLEPIDFDSDEEKSTNAGGGSERVPPTPDSPPRTTHLRSREMITKPSVKPSHSSIDPKPPNIRKNALISSGAAAHTSQAPNTSVASSAPNGANPVLPPFPVPTRSSSRRLPISASDGTRSPTPYSTTFFSGNQGHGTGRAPNKNAILRKVRSATAVPKFGRYGRRRSRSRSPPASASTFGPDSPRLPRLPQHDRMTPREKGNPLQSHTISPVMEHPVDPPQPTSVVDAIAQTMVGEWMWKYVRRRKSFGISESAQAEFEVERNHGENNSGGGGIRHKRWVWLAPYERAIMWSSKQPTSGPALLGKNGRKRKSASGCVNQRSLTGVPVTIQSVIDVHDDTPMPKHSDPQFVFDRSILILTPQRALKFTATNRVRHEVWLTALAFLSESGLVTDGLASVPPIPRHDLRHAPSQGSLAGFRRATIRDSIGIAKAKERPGLEGGRAHSNPLGIPRMPAPSGADGSYDDDDPPSGAAEPPYVPRVSSHTHMRKRSNTGPRTGPSSTSLSFPTPASMSSPFGLTANASHDGSSAFSCGPGRHGIGPSISESTGSTYTIRNNFFDAVGTVRMEAFIDPGERTKGPSSPGHKRKERKGTRPRQGRKKDLSYWGLGGPMAPKEHRAAASETRGKNDDPFHGF